MEEPMNLLSGYAPDTFMKPVMLISTIFHKDGDKETAICFGDALNRYHLMEKIFVQKTCYERAGWGDPRKDTSKFITIKKHNTWESAAKFHVALITKLNWDEYYKLYDKYCPEELKRQES